MNDQGWCENRVDNTGKWNRNFMAIDYTVKEDHFELGFYDMGPLGRDLVLKSCDIVGEAIEKMISVINS